MNRLIIISLISLSALLLSVTAQFPTLSPSYSLQGRLTENGVSTLIAVSVDINRRLQFVGETVTTTAGLVPNNIILSSEDDSVTYLSVNNVCTETAFDPNVTFPLNTNVWDLYAAGTEISAGTYKITQNGIMHVVTIINGSPVSFIFVSGTTVTFIIVTNFDNFTPAFSTFCLPSECSQFNCSACYSSAVSVSISVMLLLTTLLMHLVTTL